MLQRPRRSLEVLTISALDLFASALGVFILMAVLLFPYYLKQPSLEDELEGARRELQAAKDSVFDARRDAEQADAERREAEESVRRAQTTLARAKDAMENSSSSWLAALSQAREAADQKGAAEQEAGNFQIPDLDLVFVMDATGSMGNEIRDVQTNLLSMMRILHRLAPSLHVGFVAFKDQSDDYLARTFPLTAMEGQNVGLIQAFVEQLLASGGGDYPEPVGRALKLAVDMDWRDIAEGRIVVIGDAPAHQEDWQSVFRMAGDFERRDPDSGLTRRVAAIFTGSRDEGRSFYERLAQAGGGDFVNHRGRMIESVLLSVLADRPVSGLVQ